MGAMRVSSLVLLLVGTSAKPDGSGSRTAAWPALSVRRAAVDPGWDELSNTYLVAGSDLLNGSMTIAAAEARCAALVDCVGFTYDSAGGGTGPDAFDIFLKSSAAAGAGAGWITYLRTAPRLLTGSFTDSAVIQHDAPCLSGYGANVTGAAVSVSTDADGNAPHATTVLANNTWRLCLPPMVPGGPWTVNVTVSGLGSQVLSDILFGEVWWRVASRTWPSQSLSPTTPRPSAPRLRPSRTCAFSR